MDENKNDRENLNENGENGDGNGENGDGNGQRKNSSTVCFYVALCACVLGAVAFGLAFTKLAIYSLIASILFEIAALGFCNTQKKTNNFKAVTYLKIVIYILLALFTAFFMGGIIYVSLKS